jgi:hypothetical protein
VTAIIKGDAGRARRAIWLGADVERNERWGWYRAPGRTPLTMAAERGESEIVQLLLDAGADPSRVDGFGNTPLTAAALSGDLPTLRLLLPSRVDRGDALARASALGHVAVIDLFLANGAVLDTLDRRGHGLLHAAARAGKPEVVRHLLAKGADPSQKDRAGKTALEHAKLHIAGRRSEFERIRNEPASPFTAPRKPMTQQEFEEYVRPWVEVVELLQARSAGPEESAADAP